ncbi:MAG: 3-hydroxyacyl-CoA dehydrogenase family protein [Acidobacteria bacterium]|nr:3-hydroxyacyl-CoA dehydrogenase family protein [Acidobacteriota bacterium]
MEKIAVIGAGLMGHGIAQVFAANGHEVAIHDPFPEVLARVPERVCANLRSLGLDESSVERISLHGTLKAAVVRADIVFEAAPENLALKQDIFARLSTSAPPSCILASNTSVIPIREIAAKSEDPGRILGTHWWNPPYLIPLVEVIQAPGTESVYIEKCIDLLQRAGKVAVHVKRDVPGFVGNRLQHALWREAISIVATGICDAETVDLVVKNSFGMRLPVLGPLENADLVGLDLTLAIHNVILRHLEASPEPSPLLARYTGEQRLGMKTGKGFYEWTPESAQHVRERLTRYLRDAIRKGEEFSGRAFQNKTQSS